MILTSYYAKLQHEPYLFKGKKLIVTSNGVSRYLPKETREKLVRKYQTLLQPQWEIVEMAKEGKINEDQYTEAYLHMLEAKYKTNPVPFLEIITDAERKDVVLFCYEKSGKFCHRHLLGNWLATKAIEHEIFLGVKELLT